MNFKNHLEIKGKHAFLGASSYHWINYTTEKLMESYSNFLAIAKGTELHEFAAKCIELKQKLPKSKKTLNMYVNDAIGYQMTPEQPLYFSDNCFGTADAISFRNNFLRIHDLKTGVSPTHMEQLMVYASIFCLEYNINPEQIKIELRIYQSNQIIFYEPSPEEIRAIMDKIIDFDKILDKLKEKDE